MAYNAIDIINGSDHELPICAESGNGYVKFADGTQICFGRVERITISTTYGVVGHITYPKAFANTPFVIGQNSGGAGTFLFSISSLNNIEADIVAQTISGTLTDRVVSWIAIGRWK